MASDEDAVLGEAVAHTEDATGTVASPIFYVHNGWLYYGSLMAEGHFGTLLNVAGELAAIGRSLPHFGPTPELDLFERARSIWEKAGRPDYDTADPETYDAFAQLDAEFFKIDDKGSLMERLKAYVRAHIDMFIAPE